MNAETKFHLFVTSSTVVVMYYAFKYLMPLFGDNSALPAVVAPAVSFVTSVAAYQTIASFLRWVIATSRWIKKILLGGSYVEGTWIGKFKIAGDESIYTAEQFEQRSLGEITISGQSYHQDGSIYATWESTAVTIDEKKRTLVYSYTCKLLSGHSGVPNIMEGIGSFKLDGPGAPTHLIGHSADLPNGIPNVNWEKKIDDQVLIFEEARPRAIAGA